MQILAPLASPDEVRALAEAGADEFYCGLYPRGWYERWGRGAWPNRRGPGPANLETTEEVVELAAEVHAESERRRGERRAELFVTLNQQYYTDEQAGFLLDLADELRERARVDAFIVSDPGFASALVDRAAGARVFASTVAVALNADAVRFLADVGCSRVILSRHLDPRELEVLRRAVPEVELEVFLLNDNCYFEEGFCSTTHTMPGFGVYCMTPWELRVTRDDRGGAPIEEPEERARWDFLIEEHRDYLRGLADRGHGAGRAAMPLGPCGLCAIPRLMDIGIDCGKIVGREANLFRKLRSVQGVRYVRDSYRETGDRAETKRRAVELRGDPAGCAAGFSCYYRAERDRASIPRVGRARGPRKPSRR